MNARYIVTKKQREKDGRERHAKGVVRGSPAAMNG